jgi:cytochrome c oxidase assembly protein subunit 11
MKTSKHKTPVQKNRILAAGCFVLVAGMVGMSYAAVPLYALFCQVTGYAGTTQRADGPSGTMLEREINVRFDANVNNGLAWNFKPVQRVVNLKVGEQALIFYRAENKSNKRVTGTATFNVTPANAGAYFNKVECFCFTEQALQSGESVDMPVSFYIDPDIENDPDLRSLKTITLSYTFYPVKADGTAKTAKVQSENTTVN